MYLDLPLIKKMLGFSRKMFPKIGYAYTMMPTYTGGHIGFVLCSNSPVRQFDYKSYVGHNSRYLAVSLL